jgi:hypothetical protein
MIICMRRIHSARKDQRLARNKLTGKLEINDCLKLLVSLLLALYSGIISL